MSFPPLRAKSDEGARCRFALARQPGWWAEARSDSGYRHRFVRRSALFLLRDQRRSGWHNQQARKLRIAPAISGAWVSSAKCPVSKKRTTAPGLSRLNASAPTGRKNGPFFPHTARKRGL